MQYKAIILGASTGGPSALRNILKNIPKDFSLPIIISQRIPPGLFAESLSEALNEACNFKVRILKDDDKISNNEAILVPGGFNISFNKSQNIKLLPGDDPENSPSISFTINQLLEYFNGPLILCILTGICLDDNLIPGIKALKEKNGFIIVQKPETCFIEDLPRTVIQEKLENEIVELDKISEKLVSLVNIS
ncbi:MAG: CheB methylesterase domain-containing protein [Spirochaetota bacterium]|nr:CheB methylesterase domain-containing protein [Spirochaetota bacterium]